MPMSVVWNERTKLLANALGRASTACLTVGVLAPTASALYMGANGPANLAPLVAAFCGWLFSALVLHLAARRVLGRLS
ncbi:hypothetical protein GGR23_001752 [Gellertiella hungarica]|uniref:Uncharacterized protein n=1 Tax=Gellertiella hungarica TaxID=1572859 RepID=A0A7W6NJM3_9HYPH|nr:hypothetical protein [Gellertiella hungarica]